MEKELICTTKGHLQREDLDYKDGFFWRPNGVEFWQEYILDGEVVKRSVHACVLPLGSTITLDGGKIG